MSEATLDVNTDAASSAATATTDSPSTAPSESGVDAAIAQAVAKHSAPESQPAQQTEEPQQDSKLADADQQQTTDADKKVEVEAEQKPVDDKQTQEKGPVPYERFAEVNKAKAQAETDLAQSVPLANAYRSIHDKLSQSGVTPERFHYYLEVMCAEARDPVAAMQMMSPTLQQWQTLSGDVLPKELQEAVTRGELSLDMAKRLVAAEGRQKIVTQQAQQAQQQQLAAQQAQFAQALATALDSWSTVKQNTDIDFKPKVDGAKDGKYEAFIEKFENAARKARIQSVQDLTRLADECYAAVDDYTKRMVPPKGATRVAPRTTQSQAASQPAPKTLEEFVAARAATKHGITLAR